MSELYEFFADQVEIAIENGGAAMIFAGQLTIHAVKFERQPVHERIAWVYDNEGDDFLLDMGSIYAFREIPPEIPPSTWLPS